jgi:LysR family glycine cleavage system transcriptional activator
MQTLRGSLPSLNALALFEASARRLSFSKAAEDLAITQSAVSHGIRQLEASLGLELFIRHHRRLELSPEGERLYAAVATSLSAIAQSIDDITGRPAARREIVVAVSTAMAAHWLLPRFAAFRDAFPAIPLRIQTVDRDLDPGMDGIDLGIRLGDGKWPDHDTVPLWHESVHAVASPAYLAAHGPLRDAADLHRCQLIHYEDALRRRATWAEWFAALDMPAPGLARSLRVTDHMVALQAAMDGQGVTLGWRPIIDDLIRVGRLADAYPRHFVTGRRFYLITIRGAALRKPLSLVCDWLVAQAEAMAGTIGPE